MGEEFVCPSAERCGNRKKRSWKGMMGHAWSNQQTKDEIKNCYDHITKKDKIYYDRMYPSKKSKADGSGDQDVEIRPTYAPIASLELLKTLQDAHRS